MHMLASYLPPRFPLPPSEGRISMEQTNTKNVLIIVNRIVSVSGEVFGGIVHE